MGSLEVRAPRQPAGVTTLTSPQAQAPAASILEAVSKSGRCGCWLGPGNLVSEGVALLLDRITFDPRIMGGRACIRGMRIPVSVIVSQIAHGATFDEILKDYPDLEREDIQQALQYAA